MITDIYVDKCEKMVVYHLLEIWSESKWNTTLQVPWVPEIFLAQFPVSVKTWLRPTAKGVSAFGQHRKFPSYARKASGTRGTLQVVSVGSFREQRKVWKCTDPVFPFEMFQTQKTCSISSKPLFLIPVSGFRCCFFVNGTNLCKCMKW